VAWDTSVWWPALKDENLTIAEVMKAAGLHTGAILNYHYFDRVRRMDQGFDDYDNEDARLHQGSDPAATEGTSSREQTDKAIAYVSQHAGERFFLWVHYYDPHYKYQHHPGTTAWGAQPIDLYDEEIRFTDDQFGRLVAKLRALGLYDRTVFVITGDHGEGFGEHGLSFHGYNLYAAQTRVPIIVRIPGARPARIALPAGHLDLLPTLANLVGQPVNAIWQGRSLLGEIFGSPGSTPDGDRDIYQEVVYEGPTKRYGVVSKRWHLLYNQTPDNTWELYDLAADPAESRDVSGSGGDQTAQLRQRLLGWLDALALPPDAGAKLAAAILHARPAPRTPLDAEFGGAVQLIGVDLPVEVKAGQTAPITYYFAGRKALEGDWRFFVHIEGPSGRVQDDHVPVDGALPFSRFTAGILVADTRAPTIPAHFAPGEYTVYVGLWQPRKGNLAVTRGTPDAMGRLAIGTFRVTR
jgi:arylsulfatase A-like enzyme